RIIWLGDLNYRIALSYRTAKALVEMHNWKALLEKDQVVYPSFSAYQAIPTLLAIFASFVIYLFLCQLRIEQKSGRVFEGWNEGRIYFPPTYKYSTNSDRYSGDDMHRKGKRRTPAWCDRILWYGRGLNQLSYVCGESRFSDHRPVYSLFVAEVETVSHDGIRNMSCSSSQAEVEEFIPYDHGYTELSLIHFAPCFCGYGS
ncbi:hypothetical protein Taro_052338, partial [Colocasia esculenta]|nr:hypothetical protein [Colocasia esculenta]